MNPQGIRSAQCAFFDVMHKPRPGPSLNISLVQRVLFNCFVFKPGVEEFVPVLRFTIHFPLNQLLFCEYSKTSLIQSSWGQ